LEGEGVGVGRGWTVDVFLMGDCIILEKGSIGGNDSFFITNIKLYKQLQYLDLLMSELSSYLYSWINPIAENFIF